MDLDDSFPPDMYPIRLQGPWRLIDAAYPTPRTVRLPLDSSDLHVSCQVQLQRNFQRPTNLDREERVLLILPPAVEPTAVRLGEVDIDELRLLGESLVYDLTDHLRPSNLLQLDFNGPGWLTAFQKPVLLGIMPDADGSWWAGLPIAP